MMVADGWQVAKVGTVPLWVMDEACRSGFVPPGLWAGEGLWTPSGPGGGDEDQWKISQALADRILATCPQYLAAKASGGGLLAGLPTWAPWAAAAAAAFLWWRR